MQARQIMEGQETERQAAEHSAPHKKQAKMPLILALFVLPCKAARFAARGLWRLARKNVPLALGIALFAAVFSAMGYNALFRQAGMVRPVLFSTRAAPARKPPYVEKAISTQGLAAGRNAAPHTEKAPARAEKTAAPRAPAGGHGLAHDAIADFLEKQPPRAKAAPPRPAAVPSAKPRLRGGQSGAAPLPR